MTTLGEVCKQKCYYEAFPMRTWKKFAAGFVTLYLILTAILWIIMQRPPDQFGQVMKYVPTPLMIVLPFQPLWLRARAGSLHIGDPAPDFTLHSVDRKTEARLSASRGRPVVLIFGSYT